MKHLSIQIAYREHMGDWNVNIQREKRTPQSGRSYGFPHDMPHLADNLDVIIGAAIEELISDVEGVRSHASHKRQNHDAVQLRDDQHRDD